MIMRPHKTATCHTSANRAKPVLSLGDPLGSVFAPLLAHRSFTTPRSVLAPNRRMLQFFASLIAFLFIFLFVVPVFAQTNDLAGLSTFENSGSGLATTDIRVTIGNIIRVFLGLLGTVAIVLILYAGFLLMTAAGNEEQVAKAKKLLTNAVIGLVLVLSAFGIVSFIISRILSATTTDGTNQGDVGSGGSGGGGLTRANSFTVESVQPNGTVGIRNIVVRLNFTRDLDATTIVPGTITVTKDSDPSAVVDGDLAVSGQLVTFTPKMPCFPDDPTKTQKCFEKSTKYNVEAKADVIKSSGGEKLRCGSGFSRTNTCKETFTSGTAIDAESPTIGIDRPVNGGFVSADAMVPIDFTASDDFGVSYAAITDGDGKTATIMPGSGVTSTKTSPWQGSATWDTTGKAPGATAYTLKAKVFDLDSNESTEQTVKVKIRAAHCFNNAQDTNLTPATANETGIDCGGSDCGICTLPLGAACTSNEQCASGVCVIPTGKTTGTCVAYPRIDNVFPLDGKAGALITITGQGFGGTPGVVHFLQTNEGENKNNDDTPGAPPPQNCTASAMWSDSRIIVAVPSGLTVAGPIKVTNSATFWDDTANDRGRQFTFTPSQNSRPGLCGIAPTEDEFGKPVVVQGVDLNTPEWSLRIGGSSPGGTPLVSADGKTITGSTVPNLSPANVDVTMVKGTASSNPVSFTVKEITGKPRIDTIDPAEGPPGTYVTLKGANFGASGVVHFASQKDPTKKGEGAIDFPSACAGSFWTPESVTVKVPDVPVDQDPANTDAQKNLYDVYVSIGTLDSSPVPFKVRAGGAAPGICRLDPTNGPVGIPVTVSGDRFGAAKGKVVFYNEKTGGITSWSDQSVITQVPTGAVKGPARLSVPSGTGIAAGFTDSNTLLFTVQDCRSGVRCSTGEQCCGDGACRPNGTCTQAAAACTFAWKFTTGATPGDDGGGGGDTGTGGTCGLGQPCPPGGGRACAPGLQLLDGVCQDTMPHVIEDRECAQESQSPSPYKDTKDACKEAMIAARFTMDMHDATLTATDQNDNIKNVLLTECNTGGSLVADACRTNVGLTWTKWLAHDMFGEGAVYKPKVTPLKAGTWYRVTLKSDAGGIAGKDGTLLDGNNNGEPGDDYTWTFLTRGANDVCSIESVLVSPGAATITAPNATQDFSGLLVGPKCNLLDDTGYTWQWASSNTNKATVVPASPKGQTTARSGPNASAETVNASGVNAPIDITATARKTATDAKSDTGKLTIRFDAPTVISKWPTCDAACSNAEVGVRFSLPISYNVFGGSVDAVKLYACKPVSGTITILKTAVETQGAIAQTDGTAAVTQGNRAKNDVGDVNSPPIPLEQIEAASSAATAARKAATSARAAATAITQLMTALGTKATVSQQSQATEIVARARDVELQATAAEVAARTFSAVGAGNAAFSAGNMTNDLSTSALAITSATVTTGTECALNNLVYPAIPIRTYTYNPTTYTLRFYPLGGLLADTTYRVTVEAGGMNGIKGINKKDLDRGTNTAFHFNNVNTKYYSWTFRTKKAPATCALADVSVEPASYTSYVTGEKAPYSSVAYGAPDACNPAEGQRLDPMFYNWNWTSSKEIVGRLFSPLLNLFPIAPQGPDNNIDPEQKVISVGVEQGKTEDSTDVSAIAGGKDGKGALKVVCGFSDDRQCSAFSLLNDAGQQISCTPSQTLPDKCGVASNTCCGIRPNILASNPPTLVQLQFPNITQNVCPNVALSFTFDQPMDPATLSWNVQLFKVVAKVPQPSR